MWGGPNRYCNLFNSELTDSIVLIVTMLVNLHNLFDAAHGFVFAEDGRTIGCEIATQVC